jgi:hypothetical protein
MSAAEARPAALNPSNHEVYAALREPGCPLCRVDARSEERLLWGFVRNGILNPDSRYAFVKAGGFCRRHAWGLHAVARAEGTGAPIADVYGQLLGRDLERLTHLVHARPGRAGRRELAAGLGRERDCPVCASLAKAGEGHAAFLCELLGDKPSREAYRASEGLCLAHFDPALEQSLRLDRSGDLARWLLEDLRSRLADLRVQLREYDRKRSYTAAHEPRGAEQRSWTDVIRRYVGEDKPSTARDDPLNGLKAPERREVRSQ